MNGQWAMTTVGDEFEVELGKMLDAATNTGESKPYLGNRAVQWGRVELTAVGVVPLNGSDLLRYRLEPGDLLVCEGGEVGRAAIWKGELPECYYQKALHRLRPKHGYDVRLMLAFLEYWASSGAFADYVTQTSIAHLPREQLVKMPLPLPAPAEQRAIADVLDDAGALADALLQTIRKRQDVRTGLAQQLLTGSMRLPGFVGDWPLLRLGDHATYVKTISLSRAQLDEDSPVRYLHYGDIHTRDSVKLPAGEELMPRAPGNLIGSAGMLETGDLVFADASEDPDGVGKSVEITSVPPEGVIAGSHTIAARFDKNVLADGFKGYLQLIPEFRAALLRLAAGTKVLATTRSYISSVELALPPVDEQRAIAQVLADADAEIEALQRRLEKARQIREGMMQELLTGRTRLTIEEAA